MAGKWIYKTISIHKCRLPNVRFTGYLPGSIWECECGLQYEVNLSFKLIAIACGKTICAKQGGHEGSCIY